MGRHNNDHMMRVKAIGIACLTYILIDPVWGIPKTSSNMVVLVALEVAIIIRGGRIYNEADRSRRCGMALCPVKGVLLPQCLV